MHLSGQTVLLSANTGLEESIETDALISVKRI